MQQTPPSKSYSSNIVILGLLTLAHSFCVRTTSGQSGADDANIVTCLAVRHDERDGLRELTARALQASLFLGMRRIRNSQALEGRQSAVADLWESYPMLLHCSTPPSLDPRKQLEAVTYPGHFETRLVSTNGGHAACGYGGVAKRPCDHSQRPALMKRTTKYVGLDVHQAMTVATVRSEGGRVIARSVIETSDESITEFFGPDGWLGARWCSRTQTQAQWLYDLLSPRVDRGDRMRPQTARSTWATRGTRSMPTNCRTSCSVAACERYTTAQAARSDLTELTRAYRNLVEDGSLVIMRLKAALERARSHPNYGRRCLPAEGARRLGRTAT